MGRRIRLGVIGAGRIGRLHMKNLVFRIPEAEVIAISDVSIEAAQKCAADFGIAKVNKDYRELLGARDIEAVLICSSTDTHAQMIVEAAAAGKHIFCEKPIALDLGSIDRALNAVKSSGVKLQIGFNRRFDSNNLKLVKLIREGKIGDPHILRLASRDPAPPSLEYVKISGGIFLDMMIHDFDLARYLVGSDIEEVFALGAVRVDPAIGESGDVDTAVVSLRFSNGVIGSIDNSRKATYGYDQRVEVFGSKGMVQSENKTPTMTLVSTAEGVLAETPLYFFLERYAESFALEMSQFIACIAEGTEPPASGTDGRESVRVALAARRSLAEHRPVNVSEIVG